MMKAGTQDLEDQDEVLTEVYTWGCPNEGRLGAPSSDDGVRPIKLDCLSSPAASVIHVSAGRRHTAALTEDGRLFHWGAYNGRDLTCDLSSPTEVKVDQFRWKGVATGTDFTVGFGCYDNDPQTDVLMTLGEICGEPVGIKPRTWPKYQHLITDYGIKQLSAGAAHYVVLRNDSMLLAMGSNAYGQLGFGYREPKTSESLSLGLQLLPQFPERIVQVACGGYHTLALSDQGTVFSWGHGSYGQLGHGNTSTITKPTPISSLKAEQISYIACGTSHSIALSKTGKTWAFGRNVSGQCSKPQGGAIMEPRLLNYEANGIHPKEVIVYATGGFCHTTLLGVSGQLYILGEIWSTRTDNSFKLLNKKYIYQVWAGHYHSIALVGNMPKTVIFASSFNLDIQKAMKDTHFNDLAIRAKEETISCHKAIIRTLLNTDVTSSSEIDFSDTSASVVKLFIQFCYCYSSSVNTQMTRDLITFATSYEITRLLDVINNKKVDAIYLDPGSYRDLFGYHPVEMPLTDVSFAFEEATGQKLIKAHKIILTSRSEKFKAMFDSGMKEATQSMITVTHTSYDAFNALLHYIYTDELRTEGDYVIELLQLATEHLLERLVNKIEEFIQKNLTSDLICSIAEIANTYSAKQLYRGCLFYLRSKHAKDYQTLPDFHSLASSIKEDIANFVA